ncbi:hypothetical protein V5O48_000252 [Marasmius crinis-equi]|uniref:Calpain catalytic domain-containing protein n=1 Tax=Marasmius crinis-equi TaxID=585013 RepID=A0ABR3G1P4_9AGAR
MPSSAPISYDAAIAIAPSPDLPYYAQGSDKAGLFVTHELDRAVEECRRQVSRIATECRQHNRRFRDHDFDLELDKHRCLHGLSRTANFTPSDVQRVTQIFDDPEFFIPDAGYNDIAQGAVGDCYFIAALALIRTAGELALKFCVARDEEVGVYGFIFFRDTSWVTVLIDEYDTLFHTASNSMLTSLASFLYTHIPKYEELSYAEKQLYHHNKEKYNESARKSGQGLYFASSGARGETWVPLIEKAYAKLHGSYAVLYGGEVSEAVEDMTGGVSTSVPTKDIFDSEVFWTNELLKANVDRMFGCVYRSLDRTRNGSSSSPSLNGLIGDHCYSVLRAVEYRGKRFVILRNPWGEGAWDGPWSDGSKEWTSEWIEALPKLEYSFGDNGEFIMEYKDFLECWDQLDRTRLFDSSWVMSSHWLHVKARPFPSACSYGDVSFTFTLSQYSPVVIVLSQINDRYFSEISGRYKWTFDFMLFEKGHKDYIAQSSHTKLYARSVNLEGYYEENLPSWDHRTLARTLTEKAIGQSVVSNFNRPSEILNLPMSLDILGGQDLLELETKAHSHLQAGKTAAEEAAKKTEEETEKAKKKSKPWVILSFVWYLVSYLHSENLETFLSLLGLDLLLRLVPALPKVEDHGVTAPPVMLDPQRDVQSSAHDSIFMGLKVYSHREAPVVSISGQLRHQSEVDVLPELALPSYVPQPHCE